MFLRGTVIVGSILTIIFSFIIEFIFGIIGIKSWELSILMGFLLAGIYVGYNIGGNILKYGATAGMLTGIIGTFFIGLVSITLYWFKYGTMPITSVVNSVFYYSCSSLWYHHFHRRHYRSYH
ncbi:DUF5518 domain-containing protein [Methanobacterium sp. BAmetb5]|uniref:DUF5518 domain-containing protein n=1 Tax=Methanobacterium sp. BAmetb5 TaxID=2025351 RepID=UPI000E806412|nr:DUF5518 domain-containing protein [Methanobacterium sp. BAmetb5]AXV40676.1 MAG: hypothetical protein CIT02_10310 [Methanobacterium sp. BAmetb5]